MLLLKNNQTQNKWFIVTAIDNFNFTGFYVGGDVKTIRYYITDGDSNIKSDINKFYNTLKKGGYNDKIYNIIHGCSTYCIIGKYNLYFLDSSNNMCPIMNETIFMEYIEMLKKLLLI